MKIQWVDVYPPYGEWRDELGNVVTLPDGFRAQYGDINLIVVMSEERSVPGHGEPSMTAKQPNFIDEDRLEFVNVGDDFIITKLTGA